MVTEIVQHMIFKLRAEFRVVHNDENLVNDVVGSAKLIKNPGRG